ncbi:MAG TPA: glycosyltransferase [Candidatus Limnocylindrales bacterium]|nr:glycosyltransferase [Candidatus Limnocylindrales bacterium]
MQSDYPKLLYVGDVPVERTLYGAAQLYRLLSLYPPGDLLIVEANSSRSKPQRRLPVVRYGTFPLGKTRILTSRFHTLYGSWVLSRIRSRWSEIERVIRPFVPDAVLTVTHGYSWLVAAEYALRKHLPLHLILHDDWPAHGLVLPGLRNIAHRLLQEFYQHANSRLCISPLMAEIYQREFSSPATVLFPCAEPDASAYESAPQRLSINRPGLVVGYGGTLNSRGQLRALLAVAEALAQVRGKLVIYGPNNRQHWAALSLDRPSIELKGLITSEAMIGAFRETVNVLVVPLSFDQRDRRQNLLSFPSKLADYTAAGLPLLIIAPAESGVARWAVSEGGFAEIVTEPDTASISAALNRLAASPEHRLRLATRALQIHQEFFTPANAWTTFCKALEPDRELIAPPRSLY